MEDFYTRYIRVCKECLVTPLECVLSQATQLMQGQTEDDARILDLSSYSFTPNDCNALAKTLSYDTSFSEVRFNDCLLSEDASKILIYGLLHSRSLRVIDLKGNNLRSSGAEAVGIFLKKNTSVRCLRLDWNSLGLWGTGVGSLAQGLAVNQTLVLLDLRNNQISHDGMTELAVCLKRNSTLKTLDLRWNNSGLLGGRAFLTALQYNKSLTSLELQGNNVPQDILKAIAVAIRSNNERESAKNEENVRKERMMRTVEKIEQENTMQVSMLQTKLNEQSKVNEELTKSSHGKIQQLKESLEKNKCSFHKVSQELKSTKNDVLTRDQKISALDDLLYKMKTELTSHESKCKDLERDVQRLKENKSKLEFIIDEGKKKERDLENMVNKLEKDVGTMNVEHKSKIKEIEAKHDESVAYIKSGHSTEVKHMQSHFKDKELAMKIKIEALEKEKTSAEEKISQLKSEVLSNKLKAEEDLFNLKTQHKHEQLHSCKQNEEKISALQVSRDEQHVQINKLLKQIAELQRELNLKVRELAEVNEEKDSVAKESDRKQNDHKAEITRLKMELQSEKKTQENLKDQLSNLESNIKENSRKYKDWIANKELEIESLQEKLQGKETDLKRQREEELRRADLLESAIFTFVHSARSTRPPSPSK